MSQFIIFIRCAFVGIASASAAGAALFPFRMMSKGRAAEIFTDALTFLLLAATFALSSVFFDFGHTRAYMAAGCIMGALIYKKSFGITLDFCAKRVYNGIRKRIFGRKADIRRK